jgi:transcriptional regulator with XRE-family HTH domain
VTGDLRAVPDETRPVANARAEALREDLALRVRRTREQRGLSYREAAEQIGVPVSTVHKIEHGGDPRWSSLVRVFAWMGATMWPEDARTDTALGQVERRMVNLDAPWVDETTIRAAAQMVADMRREIRGARVANALDAALGDTPEASR